MESGVGDSTRDWANRLIDAVDSDNELPPPSFEASLTVAVLREAPPWAREQAALGLADFEATAGAGIEHLQADTVATHFRPAAAVGSLNVLVSRMLVPGSPWPGHKGLEAVVFRSTSSRMPEWFPPLAQPPEALTFAETVASSSALRQGHGHVIFPELLAVSQPPKSQRFGIILLDQLENLHRRYAVPVAIDLGWIDAAASPAGEARTVAFQAHEWGHRAIDERYAENVAAHKRRLLAVTSEVAADLAALEMLDAASDPVAQPAATALILDRVLRDAWLPRWEAHVAGVVGRHLMQLLASVGALRATPNGVVLEIESFRDALHAEFEKLTRVYHAGNQGDEEAAARYFGEYGWTVTDEKLTLSHPTPVIELIEPRVKLHRSE